MLEGENVMIDKLMDNENYEEALKLLTSPKSEEDYYKRLVCLYSLKRYEEAKIEAELALDLADKNYYDIVAIYVSILMELNEDEKALKILEDELEMPYIPYKYEVQFNASYDELLQRKMVKNKVHSAFDVLTDEELKKALLETRETELLVLLIAQLETRNIRRFLSEIEFILMDEKINYVPKTIILEMLKIQEVTKSVKFNKNSKIYELKPSELKDVVDEKAFNEIINLIEKVEANDDVNFLEYSKQVLVQYFGYIFPDEHSSCDSGNLAMAISIYVSSLQGVDYEENGKLELYKANDSSVSDMLELINKAMSYLD